MKITLVLVSILFLSASPAHADPLSSLVEEASNITDNLSGVIRTLTDQGIGAFLNATNSLAQFRSETLDSFLGIISNYTSTGFASLENAAKDAAEVGVNVTEILSDATGKLNNLADQTVQNFGQGVDAIMSDARGALQVDINKISQMITKLTGYPVRINKCLISLRPIACLTTFITDARNDLSSIPSMLADMTVNTRNTIDAAVTNLENLTQQMVTDAGSSFDKIIKDANQAVAAAIQGATGIVGTGN
ncbi:uncharacterized protein LOC110854962 [Folsomia candida]|uniref:Uncharacterized protein n=1 Tax=Folsomia candida TaxID=158441 RepID=A0A226DUP4_FOLCA|nr:uncharacterized protein LOC110854962 [Folsomia candida]OXA48748.1 hypothetical protein Fcan01_16316 [Folsomia candida]